MSNFNRVILVGRLSKDPELKFTAKGTAVCNLGIAINRTWTTEFGEKKEEVCFVDCAAFGKTAEVIGQYLKKGRPVLLEGRLKTESWEDKTTGQKKSKLSVHIESFQFLDSQKSEQATSQPAAAKPKSPIDDEDVPKNKPQEDDVPF